MFNSPKGTICDSPVVMKFVFETDGRPEVLLTALAKIPEGEGNISLFSFHVQLPDY